SQAMLFGPVCPMIVFQLNAFGFTAGARNSGMGAVIRRQDEDFQKKRLQHITKFVIVQPLKPVLRVEMKQPGGVSHHSTGPRNKVAITTRYHAS
ncbi:MAG: hypothetical protein JWM59_732, partial [Verrucomicrobiales bacterium]|nr:hypothetical protein [Verrucomicrobiales bacterium]